MYACKPYCICTSGDAALILVTVGITHEAVHLMEPADNIGLSVGYRGIVRGKFGHNSIWVNPVRIVSI